MDPEDLLDAIDELSPQAQYVLLITIANNLREAVDEGRIRSVVLTEAPDSTRVVGRADYLLARGFIIYCQYQITLRV
jgi:hypothetical protein